MDHHGVTASSDSAGILMLPTGRAIEVTPPPPFHVLLPYYLPRGWSLRGSSYYPGGQSVAVVDQPASTEGSGAGARSSAGLQATTRLRASGHPFLWMQFHPGMFRPGGTTAITVVRAGTTVDVEGDAPTGTMEHVAASLEWQGA